jgi:N-acetyl sugar amidotransferase
MTGIICKRCIYDDSIPKISFDEMGICNYCRQYDQMNIEYPTGKEGERILDDLVKEIKQKGKNKKYDCVIGVSGGCDSSYLLHWAKGVGLRPLAVHFDNTWNSKTAVENIQNVLKKLDFDLYTHVVSNKEYSDIFRSFLSASVPEIDTPSDLGLATTHYMAAQKYGIKYILEGHSFRTEGISPQGWFYMDAQYIDSIHKQFGKIPIKTLPNLWMGKWLRWMIFNGIKKVRPLYYMDYNKDATKKMLNEKYAWQWYGGHHMENRTSYFTNNYYLPKKFKIDLRYCEYSALVRNGQLSREEALIMIQQPKPFDEGILEEVKKRLAFTGEEFEAIMNLPKKSFKDYKTYKEKFEKMSWFFWILYKLNFVTKSFYVKYTKK